MDVADIHLLVLSTFAGSYIFFRHLGIGCNSRGRDLSPGGKSWTDGGEKGDEETELDDTNLLQTRQVSTALSVRVQIQAESSRKK